MESLLTDARRFAPVEAHTAKTITKDFYSAKNPF